MNKTLKTHTCYIHFHISPLFPPPINSLLKKFGPSHNLDSFVYVQWVVFNGSKYTHWLYNNIMNTVWPVETAGMKLIGSKSNLAKNMYRIPFWPSPFPASNLVGYLYPKWGSYNRDRVNFKYLFNREPSSFPDLLSEITE